MSRDYTRYRDRDHRSRKEQDADSIETLLGNMSDRLFSELRDGLTKEAFAELRKLIASRVSRQEEREA